MARSHSCVPCEVDVNNVLAKFCRTFGEWLGTACVQEFLYISGISYLSLLLQYLLVFLHFTQFEANEDTI
jgi:hypothetical protein